MGDANRPTEYGPSAAQPTDVGDALAALGRRRGRLAPPIPPTRRA